MIHVPDIKDLEPWLRTLGQDQLTWLGLSLVVFLWMLWGVAKKIVRMGYFVMALTIGCALAYGVAQVTGQKLHPEAVLAAGMSFAFLWSAIRAKVARVITAVSVAVMLSFGAHQGWDQVFAGLQAKKDAKAAANAPKKPTPKKSVKKPASSAKTKSGQRAKPGESSKR